MWEKTTTRLRWGSMVREAGLLLLELPVDLLSFVCLGELPVAFSAAGLGATPNSSIFIISFDFGGERESPAGNTCGVLIRRSYMSASVLVLTTCGSVNCATYIQYEAGWSGASRRQRQKPCPAAQCS